VPFGLILTYWYARRGRLWPLIVAHVVFDFFPLLPYAKSLTEAGTPVFFHVSIKPT